MSHHLDDFLCQPQADDADAEAYYAEQEWLAEQARQERERLDAALDQVNAELQTIPRNWTSALAKHVRRG